MKNTFKFLILNIVFTIFILLFHSCSGAITEEEIEPGAYQTDEYLHILSGKRVALVANHTSMISGTHLIDTLLRLNINISRVFSPEHGFRGRVQDGVEIGDENYGKTSIPIISIYGSKKKPSKQDMEGLDLVVFDIQDVGVRFYTYLSTLHYIMEVCAENNIPLLVFDRPNPNGFYIDGPVLKKEFKSFIGMHPVPLVYGMTIGEYALMINGEAWLKDSVKCDLSVIKCKNYDHSSFYSLPVNPSPNLREMRAIYLYPSLAFFEGTIVSEGRGTDFPFMVAGHPDYPDHTFSFTPMKKKSNDPTPKLGNSLCYGIDLRGSDLDSLKNSGEINLSYLVNMYNALDRREDFFKKYFDLLAGSDILRIQIVENESSTEIKMSWEAEILKFKKIRAKYLLYPDF